VGTGPYTVRQFLPGSVVTLQAYDGYLNGRPKIDEIEVRFISDLNTLMTNVMADAVELVLGRNFSIEQGLQLRDSWRGGQVEFSPRTWIVVYPQFINPTPALVTEAQFRRALMYATDRQQLVDGIQGGLGGVAHVFMSPVDPEYKEVESSVVRYEHDPRRAAQLIEGLGYAKGADGIYVSPAGERLSVELRSTGDLAADKAIFAVADGWTRLGVATEPLVVSQARITDREYGATFPSFRMIRQPNEPIELTRMHSSSTPLPENRFVGTNYSRYRNPEWDALLDRFLSTIPFQERMQALRPVMRHLSDELNSMGMFYDADLLVKNNRLVNIDSNTRGGWQIQDWDIQT
jgi:peptide/nickel transport system substrate-binding protein